MASTGKKLAHYIPAMLAKDTDKPFSDEDWIYEIKWDGYRAIAEVEGKDVKLYSRHGNSFVDTYPEIVEALASLKLTAVLDGEIVVLNEEGKPDFQKLQQFGENRDHPILYYVFDLLELKGEELYSLPLIERKAKLAKLLKAHPIIKYSDHIEEQGEAFFEAIVQKDLEGIMAKRVGSQYYPGKRSVDWLKIKHHKSDEAIICGFTAPRGGRKYFGALILGAYINSKLTYIGHSGSGFNDKLLKEVSAKLEPLIRSTSPFDEKVKTNMPVTWVEPKYVCEVKFSEVTSDGKLRHPIFLRLRDDKTIKEVNSGVNEALHDLPKTIDEEEDVKEEVTSKKSASKKASAQPKTKSKTSSKDVIDNENEQTYTFGRIKLKTTNRTKLYFPGEEITKGDVIDYYDAMADLILPYLKDRPQSLYRTPNGIDHKGFFQKDAGDEAPSWMKSIPLYSDSVKKEINYLLCNDKPSLLYLANLGCIEINPWHSRVKSLDNPDYLIIDIDPSDNNTFDQVIEAANAVKEVLDQAGAMGICKTSGASGMHVYVPLGGKYDYEQAKNFANLVCILASHMLPEFTTLERNLMKRSKDKIYMDYLQNRRGQTIACVYSLRPKKGATVSTPLKWNEVKKGLTPKDFNIHTIGERVDRMGDLFAPMLDKKNAIDLGKCLERLSE